MMHFDFLHMALDCDWHAVGFTRDGRTRAGYRIEARSAQTGNLYGYSDPYPTREDAAAAIPALYAEAQARWAARPVAA